MDYKLEDLVNIPLLQSLQEKLDAIYSFPSAILDNDGNILTAVAWQDICTKFHRVNAESEKDCIKSDKYILEHLHEANPAVCYQCPRGLIDNAIPIIIGGKHLGNFFTGQFFLEKPDIDFFKNQAKYFGFDENAYLQAVQKTPIWTKEKLNHYYEFIKEFIELIANIGLKNLKEIEAKKELKEVNNKLTSSRIEAIKMMDTAIEAKKTLEFTNKKLLKEIEEHKQAEEKIKNVQILLQASIESQKDMIILSIDKNYRYLCYNSFHKHVMEVTYGKNINIGMNLLECITNQEDRKKAKNNYDRALNGQSHMTIEEFGDFERYYYETRYNPILNDKNEIIGATAFSANVTERRKADEALRESEKKYRMIVETAIEGIITLNSDGRITFINQQMAALLNYSVQEMLGQKFESFIVEEQLNEHKAQMKIRESGEDSVYERCLKGKDGKRHWVLISARAIINAEGKFEGSFGMLTDITERRMAEEALRASEALYRAILNASPDDITVSDMNGRILMVSPKALTIFGYDREEEIIGRSILDFIEVEDRDRAISKIALRIQGVITGPTEYGGLRKDGSIFNIEVNSEFIRNSDGQPTKMIFIVRDITERKRIEVALLENQRKMTDIITFLPDATLAIDKDKRIIIWNKAVENMTGVPAAEMIGKGDYTYTIPFYGKRRPLLMDLVFSYSEDVVSKYPTINREGDSYTVEVFCDALYNNKGAWVFAKASPLHDRNGNIVGAIESIRDITERKLAEETLRESERRYSKAQQIGHVGSWEYNIKNDTFWGSDEAKKIYGFNLTSDFFTTEEVLNCIIERERVNQALVDLIEINKPYDLEFEIVRYKSSERRIINSVAELIRDNNGNPLKVTGVIQDITKRKQAEGMFLDIIDKNPMSIQVVDKEGYTLKVNSAHTKLFGSVPPSNYSVLTDSQLMQQGFGYLIERVKNGEVVHFPDLFYNAHNLSPDLSDVPVWIRMVIFPINDSSGKPERFVLMHENITERKRAEVALKESEALYRSIQNASPDDITITDMEGRILMVSPIAKKMFGFNSQEEVLGRLIDDFIFPDDRKRASTNLSLLFKGLKHGPDEYRGLRTDGSSFDMEVNGEFIRNSDGQPTKMIFIVRDITERKRVEAALKESQEKYRMVADFTYDWELWRGTDGSFLYVSPACKRISGYTVEEFMNDPNLIIQITHLDDQQKVIEHNHSVYNKDHSKALEIEFRIITKDGNICWISHWCTSVYSESGEWLGRRQSNRDITERKNAEKALRENEEKLSTLFDAMTEIVVLHELVFNELGKVVNYRITDCNKAFTQITGIKKEYAVGKLATDVFKTEIPPYLEVYTRVGLTGEPCEYSTYYAPMDKHFMLSVVSPKKNQFATITTDITAIRQIQEVITNKNKELENYLYVASHDLRSPLVNIQGFSQRLFKQTDSIKKILSECLLDIENKTSIEKITNDDIPRTLNFIFSNVTKMDTLINGLLQISRTGQIKLIIHKINMNKLLKTILTVFNFQITEISAKIIVENLTECYGDENLLNQLFSNIIGNALKYRDKNRQLTIKIAGQKKYNKVVYSIEDTGLGIAARHLQKIWDVFFRVDTLSSESGEGIGLSLCKRIVDKHKGKIWAESEEGKGSVFYIELQKNEFTE
ncbi:MAG: PAS domain S-box protein [bacterium]